MSLLIRALAVLAALVSPAVAEAPVTTFTLENGMEAVVIEDHRQPVVTHMVWYRIGAADEPAGKSGIAHFLEHLMFKGTDELAPGDFSRIITENGGQDNAFTSYDYTAYHQRIAADRLELVMKMEADRMRDLVLTEDIVAPELQVVLEERNQRVENNPNALAGEQRQAALYMNHPYGRPVIGWRHEVAALTREDALDWYRKYYAPNNAILVVAGDVDPAEVKRLAEMHYGPLEPSPTIAPRVRVAEPPQLAARRVVYEDPRIRQPYAIRTYLAPERDPGDQEAAAALTILAELLGGNGITSFLGNRLQIEEKVALASGAFYDSVGLDQQSFTVYVMPGPGVSLDQAEARLDAALEDFLATGPDPEHLARIRTQIRAGEIYALDDQAGMARRYGAALATGLTVEDVKNWPKVLEAVTEDRIMEAARAVFVKRQSVTGWLRAPEAG